MRLGAAALRPNHLLPALAVLLAGLAAWPFLPSPALPSLPEAAAAPLPALPALPPAATFAGVAARPLFSPSRRPPSSAQAPAAASGAAVHYRLIGVIDAGGEQRALLLDGARRIQVEVGERLGGLVVSRIEHDRVVLSGPVGETVLPLHQSEK